MNTMGDAIATLQVDQHGNKPAPTEAVLNLLDKLNTPQGDAQLNQVKQKVNTNFVTCLKYAGVLTIIVAILTLPMTQEFLDKLFKNAWLKMGAQALTFFIIATIFLRKAMNTTPPTNSPTNSPTTTHATVAHAAGH